MTKVLIVEDDAVCRESLGALLLLNGFDVESAADGREAVELARRFPPDLLIVDIALGGEFDGVQVAEALQAARPQMQTIVITGYANAELQARMQRSPSMQCLTKPVAPGELVSAVRRATEDGD